jgi:hypothetical protein
MGLEGGGWMMIMNYVKSRGVNPALLVRTSTFPQMGSEYTLAGEEGSTGAEGTWGHISNVLANQHPWTQYMFYGKTSFHSRIVHFRGTNTNIVNYIKTGSGTMSGQFTDGATNFNASLRVNASIPVGMSESSGFSNEGDSAMVNFPMYGNSSIGNPRAHWACRGLGDRWEMDDYAGNQGAPTNWDPQTIHRVFVK